MHTKIDFSRNMVGGIVAGVLAISEAMAYAVIIFAPMAIHRPEVLPLGIVGCILTIALANVIPCIMGGPRILISGPFSLTAVMLGALVAQIVVNVTPEGGEPDIDLALILLFAVISVSGIIQVLLGLFRLGDLAKYMPSPVIAGLRNGAAIAVILTQAGPILGIGAGAPIAAGAILWPTAVIGIIAIVIMWSGKRLTMSVPGSLVAMAIGTALYYAFQATGFSDGLTPVVGDVPSLIPAPRYFPDFVELLTSAETLNLLLPLLPTAFGVAILNTLNTLVAIVNADSLLETRSRSNRELIGLGLSNLACGLFGAIPASGSVTGTLANFDSGGRSLASRLTAGMLALIVVLFLGSAIGHMPKIVLAGCLAGLALLMIDRPSLRLLRNAITGRVSRREAVKDLSVIVTVMVILLIFGPLVAVGAGVFVALGHFLLSMSSDNVRREYSGSVIRSYIHRNDVEHAALGELGRRIHVMELEGPLFFGTSDRLASMIDRNAMSSSSCWISCGSARSIPRRFH